MATDGLPIDPLIPTYLPSNWIEPELGTNGQQFVRFPTAQTANILFPGSISCSNLQSFAPTALARLFNNSTSGNIEIANENTFTGGIVINANTTAPVANHTIIGTSARPLVAPLLHTTEIYGTGAFAGQVSVNADFLVANGYGLFTNGIEKTTGTTLNIGTTSAATINIGTNTLRTEAINIGTNMTVAGDINLGGTNGTTNAQKVKANIIESGSTLVIQQSDNPGVGAVQIGCGITRTGNLEIGVNTSAIVGETLGNVNIMNGAGRQEGSFNVLTNSNNRGVINLGHVGSINGGINIYADLKVGLKIGYSPVTYSGVDTFLGAYKEGTYNLSPGTLSLNTTEQRTIGSISTLVSTGLYQVNVNATLTTSLLNPYLTFGIYTKTSAAWVNGNLRGGLGTAIVSLNRVNRSPTTALSDAFTLSITGLLALSAKAYIAIIVGNANPALSQNITFVDTYISILRIG